MARRIIAPLGMFLGLLGATPAFAADLSTIGCVDEKLDQAIRDKIASEVEHNLGESAQRSSFSAPVVEALGQAAATCATENRWPVAAGRPAMLYTLAKLSLPAVQKVVVERGLDPAALEAVWFALPEEQRNKPLTVEAYRNLADAAIPEGDQRNGPNGVLMHTFFEFESLLQSASVDFAKAV